MPEVSSTQKIIQLSSNYEGIVPKWINSVDWVVPRVGIEVDLVAITNRIDLQEPTDCRRIEPRAIEIEARKRIEPAAGVLEWYSRRRCAVAVCVVRVWIFRDGTVVGGFWGRSELTRVFRTGLSSYTV